jgi:hypothetical protein
VRLTEHPVNKPDPWTNLGPIGHGPGLSGRVVAILGRFDKGKERRTLRT